MNLKFKKIKLRAIGRYSFGVDNRTSSKKNRQKVVNKLLDSKYAQLRKRAYKQIENSKKEK